MEEEQKRDLIHRMAWMLLWDERSPEVCGVVHTVESGTLIGVRRNNQILWYRVSLDFERYERPTPIDVGAS